jgi:DNA-binding GntR family transcriptional regulator
MTIDLGGDLTLGSISRELSLREQVLSTLRAAIISGRMRPGVLYPAPALAEMLGVSATPVREAMLDLVRENLVEVSRNKGFRVTTVSDQELDDMAEVRLLLEVPAMSSVAARSATDDVRHDLEELRAVAHDLERAATTDDLVGYMTLDTEFHTRFLALHGNAELVRTVQALRSRSRLYGLEKLARAGTLVQSTREHGDMINLALAGDRPGLEALTRRHIGHVRTDWADGATS